MYYPLQLDNVGLNRIIRWRDFCSNNVVPFIQEIFNLSIWVILPQWSKCNQRRIKRIEGKIISINIATHTAPVAVIYTSNYSLQFNSLITIHKITSLSTLDTPK